MDHQVLGECFRNHTQRQGWNLPFDVTEEFGGNKLDKGWKSNYQDDHFHDKDERRFGCVRGGDGPKLWQQRDLQRSKRDRRTSRSGMQAVFLSGSHPHGHSTKGSVGTGVFLPSGTRNAPEPPRKSGRSTILLPASVIQALKLHFDRMDRQPHSHLNTKQCSCHCSSPSRHDEMVNNRNGYDNARQRRRFQIAAALWSQDSDDSSEGLPQEWTY
ncbi:hypothetical protein MLD38_011556 [Melastoma candidum]|uniref:Uncharacterized protein n=1 Tax=Melastoma candidum TaxID=119954 RepID=A0ACB9R401_9MYRT|nr:hypothetical protein MLD38_011556 [Melastoma candidum]